MITWHTMLRVCAVKAAYARVHSGHVTVAASATSAAVAAQKMAGL